MLLGIIPQNYLKNDPINFFFIRTVVRYESIYSETFLRISQMINVPIQPKIKQLNLI